MTTQGNEVTRGATRGVIGAMAMTGVRRVTTGLGLLEETPPATMGKDAPLVSRLVRRTRPQRRGELMELMHWAYGGVGGAIFGRFVRLRRPWVGPAYGLALWMVYETGVVPLLGLEHARERTIVSRVFVALDHILYGVVVAGESAPPVSGASV